MKPAPVDLPTIWRNCTYDTITLRWKDVNGLPINLTDWIPVANTIAFSLNAVRVVPYTSGVCVISLTRQQTAALKMGVYQWMWYFINVDGTTPPPFLSGSVEVKNPVQFNFETGTSNLTPNEFSLTS